MSRIIIVIPARLGSTRLPNKVLADISGHPLIWHVWQRVSRVKSAVQIIIATDAEQVSQVATAFGAKVMMTSSDCQSGTDRIASLLPQLACDFILNVQGDEPLIDPLMLDSLIARWQEQPCDLLTPVFRIRDGVDLHNPNIVKVARTQDGRALYFSRSPIPFVRDLPPDRWLEANLFWGHIGVYGYRPEILAAYPSLPISPLERVEKLEQLRFLEAGYVFHTVETSYRPIAVDVVEDLEKVRKLL